MIVVRNCQCSACRATDDQAAWLFLVQCARRARALLGSDMRPTSRPPEGPVQLRRLDSDGAARRGPER